METFFLLFIHFFNFFHPASSLLLLFNFLLSTLLRISPFVLRSFIPLQFKICLSFNYSQIGGTFFLQLYKMAVQFWSLELQKDLLNTERVQWKFTRLNPRLAGQVYKERLHQIGLYSTKYRRETNKILTGPKGLIKGVYFPLAEESRIRII